MSSKKQITIDPIGQPITTATTMKRPRKMKPPGDAIRHTTVKKNLLEKIKEYKRRNEETPMQSPMMSNTDLANQFKSSSNYLEQLLHKKKEASSRKHGNKPKPKTPSAQQPLAQSVMQQPVMQPVMQPHIQVSMDLPPELQINHVIPYYAATNPMVIEPMVNEPMVNEPITSEPIANIIEPIANEPMVATNPVVLKDVPYGCLRGGIKPTYRTYHRELQKTTTPQSGTNAHKTLKKPFSSTTPIPFNNVNGNPNPQDDTLIQERQRKLRELQEKTAAINANNNNNNATNATNNNATNNNATNNNATNNNATNNNATNNNANNNNNTNARLLDIKTKIKQTITKKYKLGKTPGSNVVGVLIKDNKTRHRVQEEHGVLRRESIVEIRKYLHDHGLLKIGSDAPPDVLRSMYETARLTGDVNNVNKHVLLHNFIATDVHPH